MEKIKIIKNNFVVLLILLFTIIPVRFINADIASRDDSLPHCSFIENPNAFKDYYLIGYQRYVGGGNRSFSRINGSGCLSKGYKFNSYKLLMAPREHIDSLGIESFSPFVGSTSMDEQLVDTKVRIVDSKIDPGSVGMHSYNLKQKLDGSFYAIETTNSVIKNIILRTKSFLPEFLMTFLIEMLLLVIFLRKQESVIKIILLSFVMNIITFPIMQYVFPIISLIPAEIGVVIAETAIIKYFTNNTWRRSFIISFIINLLTTMIGVLLILSNTSLLQLIKLVFKI